MCKLCYFLFDKKFLLMKFIPNKLNKKYMFKGNVHGKTWSLSWKCKIVEKLCRNYLRHTWRLNGKQLPSKSTIPIFKILYVLDPRQACCAITCCSITYTPCSIRGRRAAPQPAAVLLIHRAWSEAGVLRHTCCGLTYKPCSIRGRRAAPYLLRPYLYTVLDPRQACCAITCCDLA